MTSIFFTIIIAKQKYQIMHKALEGLITAYSYSIQPFFCCRLVKHLDLACFVGLIVLVNFLRPCFLQQVVEKSVPFQVILGQTTRRHKRKDTTLNVRRFLFKIHFSKGVLLMGANAADSCPLTPYTSVW